jgi:hypothetical protein
MVGSQTASLTLGPSFAHNLGCRCPNDQCEGILDIYTSRPFQWHQEHSNARCFGLCYRTLKIRESRRTPNLQLWEWEFHPLTSPKVGLRQLGICPLLQLPLCVGEITSNERTWLGEVYLLVSWTNVLLVVLSQGKYNHHFPTMLLKQCVLWFHYLIAINWMQPKVALTSLSSSTTPCKLQ